MTNIEKEHSEVFRGHQCFAVKSHGKDRG